MTFSMRKGKRQKTLTVAPSKGEAQAYYVSILAGDVEERRETFAKKEEAYRTCRRIKSKLKNEGWEVNVIR